MAPPTTGRRVALGGAAFGTLVLGTALVMLVEIVSEETSAPGSGSAMTLIPLVVVLTLLGAGALFGLAIVPVAVLERGQRGSFVAASALLFLAVVFAIPSVLALFTWPLAALAALGSMLLFRRAFLAKP